MSPSRAGRPRLAALWAPIIVLEIYLVSTVLVFFWGPIDWRIPSAPKLIAFLAVNYGGLWLGYHWGIQRGRRRLRRLPGPRVAVVRVPPAVTRLLVVSMLFCIFSSLVRIYAIRGGLGVVMQSFFDPGRAYQEAQLLAQMDREGVLPPIQQFRWAFRISTVLGVLNTFYFPVALACWHGMRRSVKCLFFAALGSNIVFTVGMGTQSGIGFLLFSLIPVALYKLYVEGKTFGGVAPVTAVRLRKSRPIWTKAMVGVAMLALVTTVITFQVGRQEGSGRALDPAATLAEPFGSNSRRLPHLTERLDFGVAMLCLYASHGYEGLALSMELPFQWTYGVGWSKAVQVVIHQYIGGPDIFQRSYLVRMEKQTGWPALSWWSTIFPWIASDTTFYGTVFVLVLVGFAMGRCWMRLVLTGNPTSFVVLAQLFTLVFMFPANNALVQTLEGLFAAVGTWVIYIASWNYFRPANPRLNDRVKLDDVADVHARLIDGRLS